MPRVSAPTLVRVVALLALTMSLPGIASAASVLARADDPPPGPRHPVHLALELGWLGPVGWPGFDDGYLVGARLSFDASARVSPYFEAQIGAVRGAEMVWRTSGYAPVRERAEVSEGLHAFGVGARLHLARTARVRPYAEAGMAIRYAADDEIPYVASMPSFIAETSPRVEHDGACGLVRLGASAVPVDGLGLWLDVGWDFVLHNPRDRGLLPIRVGIQLL